MYIESSSPFYRILPQKQNVTVTYSYFSILKNNWGLWKIKNTKNYVFNYFYFFEEYPELELYFNVLNTTLSLNITQRSLQCSIL